jgi:hypothetical protein
MTREIAMLPPKIPFSLLSNKTAPAIVAALALITVAPSIAPAAAVVTIRNGSTAQQISNRTGAATDISAARRRHYARIRNAFGSIIGRPVYAPHFYGGGGYPGYGYGIGDNNRNRTSG